MVISLFNELFNNLGVKILQKNVQKRNCGSYATFDTFGRLYSWKWLMVFL